jgi:hypothetical protein
MPYPASVADLGGWLRAVAGRRVALFVAVGLLIIGVVAGYLVGSSRERQRLRDSHAAPAAVLTGRVIVSNMPSRWIIFYPDGVVDPDNDADYQWYVVSDYWATTRRAWSVAAPWRRTRVGSS